MPSPVGVGDQILEAAKKLPGNIVGGPVDLVNLVMGLAAGKGVEGLSSKPVLGSKQINEFFGMKDSKGLVEDVASAAMGMVSPGGAAKAVIVPAMMVVKDFRTYNKINKVLDPSKPVDPGMEKSIFKRTGVYRDPVDGQLKAIIPDKDIKLQPGAIKREEGTTFNISESPVQRVRPSSSVFDKPIALEQLIDHPELFRAMPELRNVQVGSGLFMGRGDAAYNAQDDRIFMGMEKSEKDFISTLLHEVQHAIQSREGFSRGGSPAQFIGDKDALKKAQAAASDARTAAFAEVKTLAGSKGLDTDFSQFYIPTKVEQAIGQSPEMKKFQETVKDFELLNSIQSETFKRYQRLGGENEARAVSEMYKTGQYKMRPEDFQKYIANRQAQGWSHESLFPPSELKKSDVKLIDIEEPVASLIKKLLSTQP